MPPRVPLSDPLNLHGKVSKQSPPRAAGPSSSAAFDSAGTASGRAPKPSHLRQRSIGTSPSMPNFPHHISGNSPSSHGHGGGVPRSPFDDSHAAASVSVPDGLNGLGILGQPTPHRAALMQSNASMISLNDSEEGGVGRSQALAMRSERAEWIPTQQFLYSTAAMGNSMSSLLVPGSRTPPSGSARSTPEPGSFSPAMSHSSSRYDVAPSFEDFAYASSNQPEADDDLHDPGPKLKVVGPDHKMIEPRSYRRSQGLLGISWNGLLNLTAIAILGVGLLFVFGGLPVYSWVTKLQMSTYGATGLGGVNASGQVPDIPAFRGLIDQDTPASALTRTGYDGLNYNLVFSDEFSQDGRLFYEGMDPFWTAVDLHYWQTGNIEWYDPDNVYTEDGFLVLELTKETKANSHGFGYLGGMLQSWNQFCFTGGYIEVAVSLPGSTDVSGLWPAAWTMSNLGRAGYGGSLDANWPYSYDACDVGTMPNQTDPKTGLPKFGPEYGDKYHDYDLSWLQGQRFSRCTCPDETDHPGPKLPDGTWKGRGATEIDIFEATVIASEGIGEVSMSGQWAPFNPGYEYINSSSEYFSMYSDRCQANTYLGGATQQVTSGLCTTDSSSYDSTTNFVPYGFEYAPSDRNGWGTGEITWSMGGEKMWRITDKAMGANAAANISNRQVTGEPLYILLNLGMSSNFGYVDLDNLVFPSKMRVDYVRVYQPEGWQNIGCDPPEYPTADYIKRNPEFYYNPNITVLADAGRTLPRNSWVNPC
ncbi:hypothetical protein JCM10908_006895 [Rhodotorula pacifica]|uniref:uncharacterized protein n=1 Tax=Rhodotorula pacifica TaxID=1495444 RepID=UPI00317981EC